MRSVRTGVSSVLRETGTDNASIYVFSGCGLCVTPFAPATSCADSKIVRAGHADNNTAYTHLGAALNSSCIRTESVKRGYLSRSNVVSTSAYVLPRGA